MRYFAKRGTWFLDGTEVELIDDYRPFMEAGLFLGIKSDDDNALDEDICSFDEFEQFDDLPPDIIRIRD